LGKKKRVFSILLVIPPLLLGLLYGGGYIAQFMRNYKQWQSAGGTPGDGTSPQTPSLTLGSCFEAICSIPYGLVGVLICIAVLALLVLLIMRMGGSESGERDRERNFVYSRKGTYGTAGFMSEKEAEEIFDITSNLNNKSGTIFGMLNGTLLGGGDAGSETIVGTHSLLDMIRNAVSNMASVQTINYGGVTVNVYGHQGQDIKALADEIEERISLNTIRRRAGFA